MTDSAPPPKIPKYLQLADRIRKNIQEGVYRDGQPIPLAEDPVLHVAKSKRVAQRALSLLEEEGWATAGPGGVWLASSPRCAQGVLMHWDPATVSPYGFEGTEIRVLSKTMSTLPAEFLEHFEIHGVDGRRASRIVKAHLENDKPASLEIIVAPASRLSGLVMKDHRHDNIYRIVEGGYRIRITRISQRIRLRPATEEEASALHIDSNSALLALDRILFSAEGGLAVVRLVFPDPERGVSDEAWGLPGRPSISR